MEIKLSKSKEVVTVPEQKVTLDTITINRIVDMPGQKKVIAFVKELHQPIVLWEGAAYDSIGQWSDSDVTARIATLYA